jgi:hypothetical protein
VLGGCQKTQGGTRWVEPFNGLTLLSPVLPSSSRAGRKKAMHADLLGPALTRFLSLVSLPHSSHLPSYRPPGWHAAFPSIVYRWLPCIAAMLCSAKRSLRRC